MPAEYAAIEVVLLQPRWHGAGEWPPSPLRLFQALLAGACLGRGDKADLAALEWLGALPLPPIIAAPASTPGRAFTTFVPNNDLDAVGGDTARIGEIRDAKRVAPALLIPPLSFAFFWPLPSAPDCPRDALAAAAHRLYQFGRGLDSAFARIAWLTAEQVQQQLSGHAGTIWFPTPKGSSILRCPVPATLHSLRQRHDAQAIRLRAGSLRQAQPPLFRTQAYATHARTRLLELRRLDAGAGFADRPLTQTVQLATTVRDALVARLSHAFPDLVGVIRQTLVGQNSDERAKNSRLQIIPLPSIGTEHTDPAIRRVLLRVPLACPLPQPDLEWAISGLHLGTDDRTGEIFDESAPVLVPTDDDRMARHYGSDGARPAAVWRSVTPLALPVFPQPGHRDATHRLALESRACHAVRQALRHAGVSTPATFISVQREPWSGCGERAEAFASPPRFSPVRLWHVEIRFAEPVSGPMILGDGRYLGLGLLAPVRALSDSLVLPLANSSRPPLSAAPTVVNALRRALMSRARDASGSVDTLFSGHDDGPGPAASGRHRHLYLLALDRDGDGRLDELLVIAPWEVDRQLPRDPTRATRLRDVVQSLSAIQAGSAGSLHLAHHARPDPDHPVFASATRWRSATSYAPTRHPPSAADWPTFAAADIEAECARRGLPTPAVRIASALPGPRGGASIRAELSFPQPISGPILLGRTAHRGGGLFLPCPPGRP